MAYKDLIAYEKQIRNVYYTDFVPKPLISYQQQLGIKSDYTVKAR